MRNVELERGQIVVHAPWDAGCGEFFEERTPSYQNKLYKERRK